jgi:hypothetical protein
VGVAVSRRELPAADGRGTGRTKSEVEEDRRGEHGGEGGSCVFRATHHDLFFLSN